MQHIASPLRRTDLVHSETALTSRLEEFIFRDRLPLSSVEPHPWGFILRPVLRPRIRQWLAEQTWTPHLWCDAVEADPFGTQLIASREPKGTYVALCAWQDFSDAATHLRTECIGPHLWKEHTTALLARVVEELSRQFSLEKRALNSKEVPSLAQTKWGFFIQLPPEQQTALINYLVLPLDDDKSLPILTKLGGNISAVLGLGTDMTRLALCFNGMEDLPLSEAQQWIPKLTPSTSPKPSPQLSPQR